MTGKADVVVVGGGIHGASLLYNLALLGGGKPVLFERGAIASGATGKSTGIVRHHYSNEICVRLTLSSRRILEAFRQEVGQAIPYQRNGMYLLAPEREAKALEANVSMQRAVGVKVNLLEPEELRDRVPKVSTKGVTLGCHDIEAGYSDPPRVAEAYLRAAEGLGAEVVTGRPLKAMEVRAGRVRAVEYGGGRIETEAVVAVPGAWGAGVAAMVGVELPVKPSRIPVGLVRGPTPSLPRDSTVIDLVGGLYWRPWPDGTTVVGVDLETKGPYREAPISLDALDEGVDEAFARSLVATFKRRAPGYGAVEFVRGWSGYDGATPDYHPIIDACGPEGFYVEAGFSGHGFKFAPMVGRCMAERVLDGKFKSLNLTPFRLSRFIEGKLFRSRYSSMVVLE